MFLLILTVILSSCLCTAVEIVESFPAPLEEYKYVVKVFVNRGSLIFCSGTVLTNKRILTVADCLDGQDKTKPNAYIHQGYGNSVERHNVSKIHFHQRYTLNSAKIWHICLLKLKTPMRFGGADTRSMFSIAVSNQLRISYKTLHVTSFGFGRTSQNDTYQTMDKLLQAKLLISNVQCPCFKWAESLLIYCSQKMKLINRCGDEFGDVGGPVFLQGSMEGILYTMYSEEKCIPGQMERTILPCNSAGYAVVIPICAHKQWLSYHVKTTHIFFSEECNRGYRNNGFFLIIMLKIILFELKFAV